MNDNLESFVSRFEKAYDFFKEEADSCETAGARRDMCYILAGIIYQQLIDPNELTLSRLQNPLSRGTYCLLQEDLKKGKNAFLEVERRPQDDPEANDYFSLANAQLGSVRKKLTRVESFIDAAYLDDLEADLAQLSDYMDNYSQAPFDDYHNI